AGAGVVGLHLDDRVVHGGQVVHRQLPVAEDAEEDHRGGEDRRHDRSADERLGQVHGFGAAPGSAGFSGPPELSTRTFPPGVTPIWPLVITCSPAFTPDETMTRSPWRCPSVTVRRSAVPSAL